MPRAAFRHPRQAAPSPVLRKPRKWLDHGPWLDHRLWLLIAIAMLGAWNAARAPTSAAFVIGWVISNAGIAVGYWCVLVWSAVFAWPHDDRPPPRP